MDVDVIENDALLQPDAALEPGLEEELERFLNERGGTLEQAAAYLQKGLVGMPALCNTVQQCLVALGGGDTKQASLDEVVQGHYQSVFAQLLNASVDSSSMQEGKLSEEDLQGWVAELVADRSWRQVIVDLHKKHPRSKLLSALRNRVRAAQGEDTSEDVSIQAFVNVLARDLHAMLVELLQAPKEEMVARMESKMTAFYAKTSINEWTYLLTQCVLQSGPLRESEAVGFFFDTLSRGLSDAASALSDHNAAVRRIDLAVGNAFTSNRQVCKILSGFPAKNTLTSGDMSELVKHFLSDANGNDSAVLPALSAICYEQFYSVLLSSLVREASHVSANARKHVWEPSLRLLVACSSHHPLSSSSSTSSPSAQAVEQALDAVLVVIGDHTNLTLRAKEHFKSLDAALDVSPAAAALILEYTRREFGSREYWEQPHEGVWTSALFALVHKTVELYRHERKPILKIIVDLLNGSVTSDSKRSAQLTAIVFSMFTHLIHHGLAAEVVDAVCDRAERTDRALLRNFVRTTLASIAPPYSSHFAHTFRRLLLNSSVEIALAGGPEVREFLGSAGLVQDDSSQKTEGNNELGLGAMSSSDSD